MFVDLSAPVPQDIVDRKRRARMDAIDALSPDLRNLVHEYGYPVVKTLLDLGVTKPNHIRHIVDTILDEFSPTRGSFSAQGIRKDVNTGLNISAPKGGDA